MDNTEGQSDDAFATGQYRCEPAVLPSPGVMLGPSSSGAAENFRDNWSVDDFRVQFSFKYNFSYSLGGS